VYVKKRFADQTDKKEKTDSEDGDRYRKRERMLTWRREKDRTGRENIDVQDMRGENGDREKRDRTCQQTIRMVTHRKEKKER
jgi:hypothetical protein